MRPSLKREINGPRGTSIGSRWVARSIYLEPLSTMTVLTKSDAPAVTYAIKFIRYFDDADNLQTYESVWQTGPESYLLVGHPANPKSVPYAIHMTPEGLQHWETEHPEGVTTPYNPVGLPLTRP